MVIWRQYGCPNGYHPTNEKEKKRQKSFFISSKWHAGGVSLHTVRYHS